MSLSKKDTLKLILKKVALGEITSAEKDVFLAKIIQTAEDLSEDWVAETLASIRLGSEVETVLWATLQTKLEKALLATNNFYSKILETLEATVMPVSEGGPKVVSRLKSLVVSALNDMLQIKKAEGVELRSNVLYQFNTFGEEKVVAYSDSPYLEKYKADLQSYKAEWVQSPDCPLFLELFTQTRNPNYLYLSYGQGNVVFFLTVSKKNSIFTERLQSISEALSAAAELASTLRLSSDPRSQVSYLLQSLLMFLIASVKANKVVQLYRYLHQVEGVKFSLDQLDDKSHETTYFSMPLRVKTVVPIDFKHFDHSIGRLEQLDRERCAFTVTLLKKLTRSLLPSNKSCYCAFIRNELVFVNLKPFNPMFNDPLDTKNRLKAKQPYSSVLKSLALGGLGLETAQFCHEDFILAKHGHLVEKEGQLLQLHVKVSEEEDGSHLLSVSGQRERKLSQYRSINKELSKSKIMSSKDELANSVILQFLSKDQFNELHNDKQKIHFSLSSKKGKSKHRQQQLLKTARSTPLEKLLSFQLPNFNALEFEQESLLPYAWYPFRKFAVFAEFSLCEDEFSQFLDNLYYHYTKKGNTFHNFKHAVTVLNGAYHCTLKPRLAALISPFFRFAFLFAALCHDAAHTGRTNLFETNSGSKLSIRYSDRSVLQNHHVATTFKILAREGCNFMRNMELKQFQQFKSIVYECIISTDNKLHFKKLNEFELLLNEESLKPEVMKEEPNLQLLLDLSLHAVDFYGNVKPFETSRAWVRLLTQEFTAQVQDEERLSIPVTEYLRGLEVAQTQAKSEIGFIKNIVSPLWGLVNRWYEGGFEEQLECIRANLLQWKAIAQS